MSFPCISERKFASLSLVGSVVLTITTSIWFSQANPERFDITLIAGILMICSANLIYFLFSDRLRPATLAGSFVDDNYYLVVVYDEGSQCRQS